MKISDRLVNYFNKKKSKSSQARQHRNYIASQEKGH